MSKPPNPSQETDQWTEIFQNLDLDIIPVDYLHSVRITFNSGKVWDIDIAKSKKNHQNFLTIEDSLTKLFNEYEDTIQNIDFRLDTEKIKKDILKSTSKLLSKKKK